MFALDRFVSADSANSSRRGYSQSIRTCDASELVLKGSRSLRRAEDGGVGDSRLICRDTLRFLEAVMSINHNKGENAFTFRAGIVMAIPTNVTLKPPNSLNLTTERTSTPSVRVHSTRQQRRLLVHLRSLRRILNSGIAVLGMLGGMTETLSVLKNLFDTGGELCGEQRASVLMIGN